MSVAATLSAQLDDCLKELRLPTVRACYPELVQQATQESLGYERFLLELMDREREGRWQRRIERLLNDSRLPLEKSLEAFDLQRLPTKLRQQVASLLEGSFVDRRENVLVPPCGTSRAAARPTCCARSVRNSPAREDQSATRLAACSSRNCWRRSAISCYPRPSSDWGVTKRYSSRTSATSSKTVMRSKCSSRSWPNATSGAACSSPATCPSANGNRSSKTQ